MCRRKRIIDRLQQQRHQNGQPTATPNVAVSNAPSGPEIFQRCSVCHQLNAGGTPGVFPPLAGSEWATGPARIPIRILLNGLSGHIVVEGKEFNNVMPAGGGVPMSDIEIATILTYVRTQFGNSAAPVCAAEVASARSETGTRTTPWSSEALAKLR
ncbi:MAG: cytochrome c [Gemmatimonadaceae bacterium]